MGDRSGHVWTAYCPVKGGYRRIDDTADGCLIQFRPDWFIAGESPRWAPRGGILAVYPGKGGANMVRFEIRRGGAHCYELRSFNYGRPKDIKLLSAILKRNIEEAPSADDSAHQPLRELSAAAIRAKASPDSSPQKQP
jgi:hypothetical protein